MKSFNMFRPALPQMPLRKKNFSLLVEILEDRIVPAPMANPDGPYTTDQSTIQPQADVVPYIIPAGTAGTQSFGGSLGMDFNVNDPITITELGVFDADSDGLNRTITAHIYDRTATGAPLATLTFSSGDPGTLEGGSRFKDLPTALNLPAGFQGTIVAEGYGAGELNGNSGGAGGFGSLDTGNGTISFVGTSRFGTAGLFPASTDGGPENRYGAGTFKFDQQQISQVDHTSYLVPAGAAGNQTFGGSLGMDFNVNETIAITELGVFDSDSDGLNLTITAHIYDRTAPGTPLATMTFSPGDPGTLEGGSRFKDLPSPLVLPAGFQGTVVAEGYGAGEPNGNISGTGFGNTDDGNGSISFVGTGRFGGAGAFPGTVDGGPENRYGAGTFKFDQLTVAAQTDTISYVFPGGTAVNQSFGGSLGMDFDVDETITITELGVFDDNSDGLNLTITAHVYDRNNSAAPLATLTFTPGDPGTLEGGSRFKDLPIPLTLPAGFQGTIVAEGYGGAERNGNAGISGNFGTTNDGGGFITYVGSGRFGSAGSFPTSVDGGPVNRYGAGTFKFSSGILANDLGMNLQITGVDTTNTDGVVNVNPDGSFTYNPNGQFVSLPAGATDTDTFDYTISNSFLEVGTVSNVDENFQTVSFQNQFETTPVVFFLLGDENSSPSLIRIKNVSLTGFDIAQLESRNDASGVPAAHNDGLVTPATISYFAIEEGIHTIGGLTFEAGSINTTTNQHGSGVSGATGYDNVPFSAGFGSAPNVVSAVQTMNNAGIVTLSTAIQTGQVNASGFNVALERAESSEGGNINIAEKIGYLAVQEGTGSFVADGGTPIDFQSIISPDNIDGWTDGGPNNTNFANGLFSSPPLVVGSFYRRDGGDGGWLRHRALSNTTIDLVTDEDQDNDSERGHTTEDAGILAFSEPFTLSNTSTATVTMTINGLNDAPTPDAGGPYNIDPGEDIPVDASASFDIDTGDVITEYRWDLDQNGAIDFVANSATTPIPWIETQNIPTPFAPGTSRDIDLFVFDGVVESPTASTATVNIGQGFVFNNQSTFLDYTMAVNAGGILEIFETGNPANVLSSVPFAGIMDVSIIGSDFGSDTLRIDFNGGGGNPIPSGGVDYDGGDPATGPGDRLFLNNGIFDTVTHNLTTTDSGTIDLTGADSGTITYTGLEPIKMTGSSAIDFVFNLPAGPDNAKLTSLGGGNLRLDGLTFESTDFAAPSGSILINAGGDTLTINNSLSISADLIVNAATININGDVETTGGTSSGDQTYNGSVVIGGNTTLTGNDVTITGTVNGSADPIAELEPNNVVSLDFPKAQNIDGAVFNLNSNGEIDDSTTIPHVTINGTGDGTFDAYSFTANAGDRGIFDIANNSVDTELFLFDSSGNLLASNDDFGDGDGSGLDSKIDFTFGAFGRYIIVVGAFNSLASTNTLGGNSPQAGGCYDFHVSVENNALNAGPDPVGEMEPNNIVVFDLSHAQNIDGGGWNLAPNPEIENATSIPHITIEGTGDGTFDAYSITAQAGDRGIFDIAANTFDTELFLFDSSGTLLDSNDDANDGDGSGFDSKIDFTFGSSGTFVIVVGRFDSASGDNSIGGNVPPAGGAYDLHVSIENHDLAPFSLTINTNNNGITTIAGDVGSTNALSSMTTNADGDTFLGGDVTTSGGTVTFGDAVTLINDVTITDSGSTGVTFDSTVDSDGTARELTVNTPGGGTTSFNGNVGSGSSLASVTTDAAGQTIIGGDVTTSGGTQTYGDPVEITNTLTLTDTGGTGITFAATVTDSGNNHQVTVDVQNVAHFQDSVQGTLSLVNDGPGTLIFGVANHSFDGTVEVNDGAVDVQGDLTANGGDITLFGNGVTLESSNGLGTIQDRAVIVPIGIAGVQINDLAQITKNGGTAVNVAGDATLNGNTIQDSVTGIEVTGAATVIANVVQNNDTGIDVNNGSLTLSRANGGNQIINDANSLDGLLLRGDMAQLSDGLQPNNNHLGNTIFQVPSLPGGPAGGGNYIRLTDDAFFGFGEPELVDASEATFEDVATPISEVGANLTGQVRDDVEDRVVHFLDVDTVGLVLYRTNVAFVDGGELVVYGGNRNDRVSINAEDPAKVTVRFGASTQSDETTNERFFDLTQGPNPPLITILTFGGEDDVRINGDISSRVFGGEEDDDIRTGDGDDFLSGGNGNDRLRSGKGDDIVVGGMGRDVIFAEDGDDLIVAGATPLGPDDLEAFTVANEPDANAALMAIAMTVVDPDDRDNADRIESGIGMDRIALRLSGRGDRSDFDALNDTRRDAP